VAVVLIEGIDCGWLIYEVYIENTQRNHYLDCLICEVHITMSYQQQQQQRRRFVPPEVGSIHQAIVTRIESYGCFVKFISDDGSPTISGLVHISQLTSITNNGVKISDVNDVVSIDDQVYVKVIDVSIEQTDDGRQRHKFKLSMKYVHQDTGQDLDPDGELMEQDLMRSQHRSGGGGSGRNTQNFDQDGTGGANSLLGRSLASNIGMSSAIDPGSLILKGKSGSVGAMGNTKFNGYSLVGEDEGEDEAPTTSVRHETAAANVPNAAPPVRPMGRGRATTLPAWMTRQDDDRLGSMKDEKGPGDGNEDGSSRGDRHRKKSSRRDKHHRHKDRKRSSSRKQSRKHKRSSRHRSRSRGRSRSESYYSSPEDYSRSRSRSPSYKKKRKKSKHRHRRHRGDREDYSRSRSRSSSDSRDFDRNGRGSASPPSTFNNVEEARAIMERLERRQREG